jgi:polysaccharide biosynthesis/export protein
MTTRLFIACLLTAAGTTAVGLAQAPQPPLPQPPVASEPAPSKPYVLQAGDEITIKVFNNDDLLDTVMIRPDGMISVLLLDDVEAAGLTASALDAKLTTGYAKFFRDPQVTVIVRNFANLRVYVGGEVGQPGPVPLRGEVTALQAIIQVGGFRPTARLDSVILLRNDGTDRPVVSKLNFKELLDKKQPDVALQPFDVLYVPLSRIAKADKFVDQYMRQLLPISLTGGFTYILDGALAVVPR